jgi:hypothetical protein
MAELDLLRDAYRRTCAAQDADHLSELDWERLACDELSGKERRRAFDHIIACPLCSDTYRALQELRSEAAAYDDGVPMPVRVRKDALPSRRTAWWGLGAFAAAAVAVIAVVLPLSRPAGDRDAPLLRSADEAAVANGLEPSDEVVEHRRGEDLLLSWRTVNSTAPVVVEVLDGDGELVWTSSETATTSVTWPGRMIPGPGTYYWRVVADDPAAGKVASELASFELVLSASPP